jgi:hypothetical protein
MPACKAHGICALAGVLINDQFSVNSAYSAQADLIRVNKNAAKLTAMVLWRKLGLQSAP